HGYHIGHEPHPETQAELARRGIAVGEHRSRFVTEADRTSIDLVIGMDDANMASVRDMAGTACGDDVVTAELSLLLDHASGCDATEVPDPYYVGGYDRVYDLVDAGCRGLLERVRELLD